MASLSIETGADAFAPRAEYLDDSALGVRFVSYRNFERFEAQTDPLDPGLIVWPGGDLAESRADRYGLEYDGLYNDAVPRPGLDEMMAAAVSKDAALSVTLPTVRYIGREADLVEDIRGFMTDLLSGSYGAFPKELILEVGSEYYAHFSDGPDSAAAQYAVLADLMVTEIAIALNDPAVNSIGADTTIAVQAGKTFEDDIEIRDTLSDFALSHTDMVVHHRFSPEPQGIDRRMEEVENIVDSWEADVVSAGGSEPELFVSAWNVAQFTRMDALKEFLDLNPTHSESDVDLLGRTTTDFEQFWQDRLEDYAYGAEHPGLILEAFSSYAEAGMSAGAVFGSDVIHPGRLSWRDDAREDHTFVGGEMIQMIYESVEGTRALASDGAYDQTADVTPYAFEGDDRLVVFLSAGDTAPGEVTVEIEGLGSELVSLWADSLTADHDPDWMHTFGIPDNPAIDESPEAATYAPAHREAADVEVGGNAIKLSLGANEVVRLAFAKTEDGADALQAASVSDEIDIEALSTVGGLPVIAAATDPIEPDISEVEAYTELDDGGGGGMGLIGLILPLLLLL